MKQVVKVKEMGFGEISFPTDKGVDTYFAFKFWDLDDEEFVFIMKEPEDFSHEKLEQLTSHLQEFVELL